MPRVHNLNMHIEIILPYTRHSIGVVGLYSSQMTGTFVQGMVSDLLSADAYMIPENLGQVEAILNDAWLLVSVTTHILLDVDFPHVLHGRGLIYNPY